MRTLSSPLMSLPSMHSHAATHTKHAHDSDTTSQCVRSVSKCRVLLPLRVYYVPDIFSTAIICEEIQTSGRRKKTRVIVCYALSDGPQHCDSISIANQINTYGWKMHHASIHSWNIHCVRIIEYGLILFHIAYTTHTNARPIR